MSSRERQKERRRAERIERQQTAARREARKRLALTVVAFLAIAGGGLALFLRTGDSGEPQGQAAAGFGPNYAGLEQRRVAAGIPTMGTAPAGVQHIHPRLFVYVEGRQIAVPAGVGIDPERSPNDMAGLHTHDPSGTIHVEGAINPRLGDFFTVWGVKLTPRQLGRYRTTKRKNVRMWDNGRRSEAFGTLRLRDGAVIVVSYDDRDAPPPDKSLQQS